MKNLILILILFLFSCDDSYNPVANEYRIGDNSMDDIPVPCCVYPPEDINLMMAEQQEGNNPTGRKDYQIYFANGGDRTTDNVPEMDTCRKLDVTMLWGIGGGKIQSSSWLINGGKEE